MLHSSHSSSDGKSNSCFYNQHLMLVFHNLTCTPLSYICEVQQVHPRHSATRDYFSFSGMTTAVNRLDLDADLDCLSKLSSRCQCDLSTSKSAANDCGITVIEIPPNKLGTWSRLHQVQWATVTGLLVFRHHFNASSQLFACGITQYFQG